MCIGGVIVDYLSDFQIYDRRTTTAVARLCRKYTTKFATFLRATCFVNSLQGGTVGRTTDRTCDHICDLS